MNASRNAKRSGFTLLEVVLALTLAAIAISMLAQLVGIGNTAAASSRDRSKAQLVAQSVMSELTSGIVEPVSSTGTTWEFDPMWKYDVQVTLNATSTINIITVTATYNVETSRPTSFSMTQWLAIPPEPVVEETEEAGMDAL